MIKANLKQNVTERLERYARIGTASDPAEDSTPSTPQQWDLLTLLKQELETLGLSDITLDDNGYLFASLPANIKGRPILGLLAHVDTAPGYSGDGVKPQIIRNYDGQDIVLEGSGEFLSPKEYPALSALVGHDIMTTDGTTLLGADDKAGIAIILSAIAYLLDNPNIPHGKIRVGFTPDEEIGRGPHKFDVQAFGADVAFTIDGSHRGELQYENFNAAEITLECKGFSIHLGSAKNKLINACERAFAFHKALPAYKTPESSEGLEGFIALRDISGSIEKARLSYLLRDFTRDGMLEKKAIFEDTFKQLQTQYGKDFATLSIKDQYANMIEKVSEFPYVIDIAKAAMRDVGIEADTSPIRGGTDGAQLSFMGLPTPNLFTGGANFHGPFEYISLDVMNESANVVLNLIRRFATDDLTQ